MTCLNKPCRNAARSRGLCSACYMAAWRLVRDGATTWQEIASLGRVAQRPVGERRRRLLTGAKV